MHHYFAFMCVCIALFFFFFLLFTTKNYGSGHNKISGTFSVCQVRTCLSVYHSFATPAFSLLVFSFSTIAATVFSSRKRYVAGMHSILRLFDTHSWLFATISSKILLHTFVAVVAAAAAVASFRHPWLSSHRLHPRCYPQENLLFYLNGISESNKKKYKIFTTLGSYILGSFSYFLLPLTGIIECYS